MATKVQLKQIERKGKITLALKYTLNGKRVQQSTGLYLIAGNPKDKDVKSTNAKTMAEAEKMRLKKELEIAEDKVAGPKPIKLLDFWRTVYMRHRSEYAWNTQLKWANARKKLELYLNERGLTDIKVDEVTVGFLEDYKLWLQSSNRLSHKTDVCMPASVNAVISKLSMVLRVGAAEDLCKQSTANHKNSLKIPQKEVDYLTDNDVKSLMAGTYDGHRCIDLAAKACLFCGLRISDLEALKWNNVKDGELRLTTIKTKYKAVIPISKQLEVILADCKAVLGDDEYVFGELHKLKTTSRRMLQRYFDRCGIQSNGRGWHVLRKTFCVTLLNGGVSIYVASKLMTHTSVDTIKHYENVKNESLVAAIRGAFG